MKTSVLALLLFCCTWMACTSLSGTKTLKLAHGLDVKHPVHRGIEFMAQQVAAKSNGKLRLQIYPNQQLGSERQLLELLQIGSVAMTKVSGAVMENFAPNYEVLSIPYIFRDKAHLNKTLDGEVGKQLLLQGEKYWLRGLTYFDAGQRSFYCKTPIRTPDDLINKKIRVQESVTAMQLVRALGAAPTPISYGEIYTALQQGIVDGAENNPPSFYTSRHYEICKYYTLNEHTGVPDILLIGKVAWDGLSEQERIWLQAAADEAKDYERKLWQEAELEALEAVKAAGVEIILPDKSLFAEKTKSILENYQTQPAKYALIQQIQAVQ